MGDDDIKNLPDDFVGNSKPSKVIERLNAKREKAEKEALANLNTIKKEICEKYEKLLTEKSEGVNKELDDVKGLIKRELFDAKLKSNHDNATNMYKTSFQKICNNIHIHTSRRQDIVEKFYNNLVTLEKEKSNEFKEALRNTYEEIKRICYKLPSEYDECIELEIEKVNQSILCNQRNYKELKKHLQLEIENDCKNFIVELKHVKECWINYLRSLTDKAIGTLKGQNLRLIAQKDPKFLKSAENLKNTGQEITGYTENVNSVVNLEQAEIWLKSIRNKLAKLDHHSQKMIATFKQAAVYVFNRFFQELKVITDQLSEMIEKDEILSIQCEMYTPTLEEIQTLYDAELATIQRIWNELVDHLSKTVDNTYKFLRAGATLWDKHFKRTELLEVLILKDVDNTIIANNSQSEPYETKLNILIDTLRQEPSKDRLNKTLEDIKKLLTGMEELYKSQYQLEVGVYKKYKATQDFKFDLLLAEMKRFIVLYPPDLDKDPKIQRKRASWTSEIADPTEGLIPNQMMFCKYQIDAVANWQFGLWEAISNYAVIAKTEISGEVENWVKTQTARLDTRLDVRLSIHSLRMEKIMGHIYDVRMEELCIHQTRFEEHKDAVEQRIDDLKEQCGIYLEKFNDLFEIYDQSVKQLESKCITLPNCGMVNGQKIIVKAKTENCIEDINNLSLEYLNKGKTFLEEVKASNIKFAQNMKLFLEGGNFSIQETKDYLKLQSKIEAQVDKSLTANEKDIEGGKNKIIEKIKARNDEVLYVLLLVAEEHTFLENIERKLITVKNDLKKQVCLFQHDLNNIIQKFNESKMNIILNCGNYSYLNIFIEKLKEFAMTIGGFGKYLCHPTPIILYSDKTADRNLPSHHPHKAEEKDVTSKLFNFEIDQDSDNFLMNLNKILFKGWNDIMTYAQGFYTRHHQGFFLDESKISHTLPTFSQEIFETFLNYQNQCETRWIRDTKEYLEALGYFFTFVHEYVSVFSEEYIKRALKDFNTFFESEMRQPLREKKDQVTNLYVKLLKKLKPLYGHPNNRSLLEKLEIEAKMTEMEAREILDDSNLPPRGILQEKFDTIVKEFATVNNLLLEVEEIPSSVRIINEELIYQSEVKTRMLRRFVNDLDVSTNNEELKRAVLNHCKSFISTYDKHESGSYIDVFTTSPSITWKSEADRTQSTNTKSQSLSKTPGQSTVILSIIDEDVFLVDLQEAYEKCLGELEGENFEEFVNKFVNEWNLAVATVLNLYKVKYDQ